MKPACATKAYRPGPPAASTSAASYATLRYVHSSLHCVALLIPYAC